MENTTLHIGLDDDMCPTIVTNDGKEIQNIVSIQFSSLEEVNMWGKKPISVQLTVLVHPMKKD